MAAVPRLGTITVKISLTIAVLICLGAAGFSARAESALTSLHSFGDPERSSANPRAELIQGSDGMLYGTTSAGGVKDKGTLFRLNTNGDYTIIKSFGTFTNDGEFPFAAVLEGGGGKLYGTTSRGGAAGFGTVFSVNKDGSDYAVLKSFTGSNGAYPEAPLLKASDDMLYGTAAGGGTNDNGVIFRLAQNGTAFEVLRYFMKTNGANPLGGLLEASDLMLYGTTDSGGVTNLGTIFRLNKDGSDFTVLRNCFNSFTNGTQPCGRLYEGTNGYLFGVTAASGSMSNGTIYTMSKDGTDYRLLKSFGTSPTDGKLPQAGLILASDGWLYGTTYSDAANSLGTIYRIGQNGSNYLSLASFAVGRGPAALVEASDGMLYGTTEFVVSTSGGTVFKIEKSGGSGSLTTLQQFNAAGYDGTSPYAGLLLGSDNVLYGNTRRGGSNETGLVFSIRPNGLDYQPLIPLQNNGYYPVATLLENNGSLVGVAQNGGISSQGAFFTLQKDGTGFSLLRSLASTNGRSPMAAVIKGSDNLLYGTAAAGGNTDGGVVFRMNLNGSALTILVNFGVTTNGKYPVTPLLESSNVLYGTTYFGGSSNNGTVFKLNKDGTGYMLLKSFGNFTNEGICPATALLDGADGWIYGATYAGGSTNNAGTIFRITTNGGFQTLRVFTGRSGDGRYPSGQMVTGSDGAIYGTTERGGVGGSGTIFKLNKDGSGYAVLASFTEVSGRNPHGGLALDAAGSLYGTADQGGAMGLGTVFRFGPVDKFLDVSFAAGQVFLKCQGSAGTLYTIERAANLTPPVWQTVKSTNAPAGGIFEVIDANPPVGGGFYRMQQ